MTQIKSIIAQIEELEHKQLMILGKLAIGIVIHLFIICWFFKVRNWIEWALLTTIIAAVGMYIYKRWYKQYKLVKKSISVLNKELEGLARRQMCGLQDYFCETLYIRRS